MKKYTTQIFRSLLFLISLTALADVARAQSSLIFGDDDGRTVEFTNFGTLKYTGQNLTSRGYEVIYGDGPTLQRAWYLNSSNNSGFMPVSISADQPNGQILSAGEAVYVRVVVQTTDGKLKLIFRYIWRAGSPGIEAICTIINNSNSPLAVGKFSIFTPVQNDCRCPCEPVKAPPDGTTLQSVIIAIPPNEFYRKTTVTFTAPTLNRSEFRDVKGCDPPPPGLIPVR